ncbi:MAG: hypothetical protein EHM59_07935 [Betaproteobacteria bacterium]|nr:MAG: hypothetical protein EHM59_07935 [Betaproteobacteria bacterium]
MYRGASCSEALVSVLKDHGFELAAAEPLLNSFGLAHSNLETNGHFVRRQSAKAEHTVRTFAARRRNLRATALRVTPLPERPTIRGPKRRAAAT